MQSPCLGEIKQGCLHGWCTNHLCTSDEPHKTITNTSSASRHNFAKTTASSFFPNTHFTNHESLPSLQEAFTQFSIAYPQFSETNRIEEIRAQEYCHLSLSSNICLDYIGIGLFSHSQVQSKYSSIIPIASTSSPPPQYSGFPVISLSYKSVNLKSQLLHGGQGSDLESAIKKRIMDFLNISENDYSMVFTANRSSAFKLVAECYPFQSSRKLLTVYDYESEAVEAMVNTSEKRGARVMSAEFKWPRLRVHSIKLRKMIVRKKKKAKKRGLFVFPLQSRMTGGSYSYQWMSMAQENGWHVLLDACALGKDMDSFGLSLFRPDFLICSFYKVFGENPTGFGCLFVKKSTVSVLETSIGSGIVSIVPAKKLLRLPEVSSGTDTEIEQSSILETQREELTGPNSVQTKPSGEFEKGKKSEIHGTVAPTTRGPETLAFQESDMSSDSFEKNKTNFGDNGSLEIECRGLDHVDSLGLALISGRARCLINWLVNALMKLQHPNTENQISLVKIYGPKIKFHRGPALAFNVYDWKGEKVEPVFVQKLADRNNISLSHGSLHQIWFSDKYEEEKERLVERHKMKEKEIIGNKKKKAKQGITVVTAALGFLANFEDTYRLWAFVARFLDADFVEKERWRYTALNQKKVEL